MKDYVHPTIRLQDEGKTKTFPGKAKRLVCSGKVNRIVMIFDIAYITRKDR